MVCKSKRIKVMHRDKQTCQYCGELVDWETYTLDHINPKTLGGDNALENLVVACRSCNSTKNSRSLYDFRKIMTFRKIGIKCFTRGQENYLKKIYGVEIPVTHVFYFENGGAR